MRFEKVYYEDDSDDLEELRQYVQIIRDKTTIAGRLSQLAEEAAELSAAASKAARVIRGESPTPCTLDECIEQVHEEIADVTTCMAVMHVNFEDNIEPISCYKLKRWAMRLQRR